ncbi:hypothetical protein CVT24_006598 [Panaeolus cyanescens]|uniref:F-box domain-containing protein n=1 Tax=Panaeolus cyanescens TaxID=181874 RepID=A0A409WCB0_9AGAR|nr:hypothetical protein CVT24_006598 [Panaeolus cyanescens]
MFAQSATMANNACDTTYPVLPVELEQNIVEIAAFMIISFPLSCTSCALELQLTAQRFREWTMPFLYRVLHANSFSAGRTESESTEILNRYGKHIRHFFFGWDIQKSLEALKRSPMVQSIVNWNVHTEFEEMHSAVQHTSSLRRLSIFVGTLKPELLSSPVYCNITHIEIAGFLADPNVLVRLPNLTHLCIYISHDVADFNVLLDPGRKPLIQVVVYFNHYPQVRPADARVIKLKRLDTYTEVEDQWMRNPNGEMDFWELAERMVYARRGTFFSISSY